MIHLTDPKALEIREHLMQMSTLAHTLLKDAVLALIRRDPKLAIQVQERDSQLDAFEKQIDREVVTFAATHAPMATHCRFMLVASKVSANLEAIGDQAVTICRRTLELVKQPETSLFEEYEKMANLNFKMLDDAMQSLLTADAQLAFQVIQQDKLVDKLNRAVSERVTEMIIVRPNQGILALDLVRIAQCLERSADHSKNIAEESYYFIEAKDIRHERKGRNE